MSVLRRNRRQADLGLLAAQQRLTVFLDELSNGPGAETTVVVRIWATEWTLQLSAFAGLRLVHVRDGDTLQSVETATSMTALVADGVGPELTIRFPFETDLTRDAWICFPEDWGGVIGSSGATISNAENAGTGIEGPWIVLPHPGQPTP